MNRIKLFSTIAIPLRRETTIFSKKELQEEKFSIDLLLFDLNR